ncbi:MAG TPA: DUF4148 domain-containing protein [Paraburkholderia sp.]|jgi:hypothetical protein|nr:DUF4148 domain-containing protein [Paraburkholderia sp.]
MKSLINAVALAAVLAVPTVSFAQQQTNQPLTRAQVRNQLEQLERAGYRPEANDPYYPQDIQAAEARVARENGQTTGYGPATSGSSQSGGGNANGAASSYSPPIYNGH